MSKKNQQKNTKKAALKRQAQNKAQNPSKSQISQQQKNKKEPMTWRSIATLVIVVLVVLGLVGSMSCGIIASAYGAPIGEAERRHTIQAQDSELLLGNALFDVAVQTAQSSDTKLELPRSTQLFLEGDLIDGKSYEEYVGVTEDLPLVESPMAGMCTSDGRLLFERNIDNRVPIASTTKMMTAIIALETLPLDTPLVVTHGAANTFGTEAGLEAGMTISLLDCLYALLLPSGNDAAVVIAENVSDMESRFVELMNAKAAELGMSSTNYLDASGLETAIVDYEGNILEENYSTVRDYLLLARYCMSNETFRTIVATDYYEVTVDGVLFQFETTSKLKDYMTTATPLGIKTGYTDDAGYCYVGCGNLGGVELYTVVFNAPSSEQRFADTANLLEWGLRHYRTIEIINTSQQVAEVALTSWIDASVAAYVPAVVRVELFDLAGPIQQEININDIEGEATKGQACGEIVWSQGGEVLTTSKVVADKTVLAPNFFEGLGIAWDRFWGGFSDVPAHVETQILLKSELSIPSAEPVVEE